LRQLAGIRSPHDLRELIQKLIMQIEFIEESVEVAAWAAMRERDNARPRARRAGRPRA
jgi:hypothetical protein